MNGRRYSLLSTGATHASQRVLGGSAENIQDLIQLVDIIPSLEDWPSSEEFRKDATNGPHVD